MSTTTTALPWTKPARERHAHIGALLADILEGVAPAAKDLAHYLFRECIAGKWEEINLYTLPLGMNRLTEARVNRPYARNTLRRSLQQLVDLGLVIIDREFRGGWFRLTVQHPGETRPFTHTQPRRSKFGRFDPYLDQNGAETIENASPITEIFTEAVQKEEPPTPTLHFPPQGMLAPSPPSQGRGASPRSTSFRALDLEPPTVQPKRCGENEEKISLPKEESQELEGEALQDASTQPCPHPEEEEVLRAVRDVCPMNPQLMREVVKFSLSEVEAAITLYRTRHEKRPIANAAGFLVKALRGGWARKKPSTRKEAEPYPDELTRWYAWASREGLTDGRPLSYLPHDSTGSAVPGSSAETLMVALAIPPHERQPWEGAYRFVRWQEARRLHPLPE